MTQCAQRIVYPDLLTKLTQKLPLSLKTRLKIFRKSEQKCACIIDVIYDGVFFIIIFF